MSRKEIQYHYRGPIERGARYTWRDGYSRGTGNIAVEYPWSTKRECQRAARSLGGIAVFYRDGKREPR